MKFRTGESFNLDAKPTPGTVVEAGEKSFRVYFHGANGEEPEVLEFEHRPKMDPGELNVRVSQTYNELAGNSIPEGEEFNLDANRAVFTVVWVFRLVPFGE